MNGTVQEMPSDPIKSERLEDRIRSLGMDNAVLISNDHVSLPAFHLFLLTPHLPLEAWK